METEQCVRCGRVVSIDSAEFTYGEAIGIDEDLDSAVDHAGNRMPLVVGWVCEGCVTPDEEASIFDDYMGTVDQASDLE